MRVAFLGSAEFACPAFDALAGLTGVEIVGIVTQPDRPRGRCLERRPCDLKAHVGKRGIPVWTPERLSDPAALEPLRAATPDLMVVVAYGQILSLDALAIPRLGCVNLHASLLPRYRGAAPIQRAVEAGEEVTGVTTMFMNERMDAGDIIFQEPVAIGPDETAGELHDRLARIGAGLLARTVLAIAAGAAPRAPQNETQATFARKLRKEEGAMDWTLPARALRNRVRAFNPWPMCRCEAPVGSGRRLRVLRAEVVAGAGAPGEVLDADAGGPVVACGGDALRLAEVQPESGRPMPGGAYLLGRPLRPGDRLG